MRGASHRLAPLHTMRVLFIPLLLLLVFVGCSSNPELTDEQGQAVARFEEAVGYARDDHFDAAVIAAREAIELEPGYVEARHLLATLLEQAGETDLAIEELVEILAIDPGYLPAGAHLGFLMIGLGRREEARQYFLACLDGDPEFVPALVNLGIMLRQDGRPEDATVFLFQAVAAASKHANAQVQLARALTEAGRPDEAKEHWEDALDCPGLRPDAKREAEAALGIAEPDAEE